MKILRSRSKKRSNSKPKTEKDKETQAKLELAQEEARQQRLLQNGRHPHSRSPQRHNNKDKQQQQQQTLTLDLNANVPAPSPRTARSRTRQPITKTSPNRSSLVDDSEAGKARRRQRRRRCSSVNFCEQLEVKDIIPAKELVNSPKKLWWQSTEYQKIVELSCAIVDLSKVDKSMETRGLEDLIRTDHQATNKTRHDVLMAQRILRQRQIQDEEALGGLYQTSTAKYLEEAARRAHEDEKEVQNYLADTRRMARRTWSV